MALGSFFVFLNNEADPDVVREDCCHNAETQTSVLPKMFSRWIAQCLNKTEIFKTMWWNQLFWKNWF